MTVVERKSAAGDLWTAYTVRRLESREHIRALLETRRPYAAYALGQLEPHLFRQTEWWQASSGGHEALVLHSRGGLGHATFTMGEAGALEAALRVHPGGRHTFLTCEPHHLETVLRHFDLDQRQTMIRMQVSRETFRPVAGPARRLTGMDAREINRLYRVDGVPSYYSPRQIDDAVYFGATIDGAEVDGQVAAVAGTHVISAASGIAVVGNVYTHPRYRNMKLAQAVTSAVTRELLERCREVVLSVDPANVPAVAAYARLGYEEVARLIEGAATRRDVLGAETLLRRVLARLRGSRKEELVRIRTE
jgi:ribosomal protein S18 acetylase RimI-like enzyme